MSRDNTNRQVIAADVLDTGDKVALEIQHGAELISATLIAIYQAGLNKLSVDAADVYDGLKIVKALREAFK